MHILLTEDDDFLRQVYTDQFTQAGYAVTCAEDGLLALEKLKARTFDLILCDVLMPHMDGFHMLESAKAAGLLGSTPVIMLTNVDDQKDRDTAVQLGVKEYFLKTSMNIDELVQLVKVFAPIPKA
ncbi:MAG: chemotaxis regulator [Candidatus Peribacteria bacterium]|nr:chemotaxis regulator [Candidatus Peribacteria bacterium]